MPDDATPAPAGRRPRVVIVPGFGATPADHWFPWLASAAVKAGAAATVVPLPEPGMPARATWEAAVRRVLHQPSPHTWLVAHSLGCITSLRVLEESGSPWQLGGLVLVAGFSGPLPHHPALDTYLEEPAPAETLAPNIARRVVIASDNDPSVPPARSRELAARLAADLVILRGRGHFRARDGVTELPEVLREIFPRPG